jgi:hypothetical protein
MTSDVIRGYQLHIHDRGDFWEAALTTTPKRVIQLPKTSVPTKEQMKQIARESFREALSSAVRT